MEDLASNVNSLVMFDDSLNNMNNSSNYVTNNIASNVHPRLHAYKKSSAYFSDQEQRRNKLLAEQKKLALLIFSYLIVNLIIKF